MSISDLGSLGEFVASIAVVFSVLYLAFQIREQRIEERRRSARALENVWNDVGKSLADNESLAEIFIAGMQDYDNLDPRQRLRFSSTVTRMFKGYEGLFYLNLDGTMDEEVWKPTERMIALQAGSPGFRQYWIGRSEMFRPQFRNLVEQHVANDSGPQILDQYGARSAADAASP